MFQRKASTSSRKTLTYLHSNMVIFQPEVLRKRALDLDIFTFQYGYISTRTLILVLSCYTIYIPIWLYFNYYHYLFCLMYCTHLHSNMVIFQR